MTELPHKIGFVGLGLMGLPMARNLAHKTPPDTHFYVYDVAQEPLNEVSTEHKDRVTICSSPKEVADGSDTIITMLPEGTHVRTVYLTPQTGLLASSLDTKLLIDCSTIDTATSLSILESLSTSHPSAKFYDAPVSGGVHGAQNATLTFMLGCSPTDPLLPLLTSLLGLMGTNIFPCGGPSLGLTAKQCNNYCSGLVAIAVSEAMNIGIKAGMDPRVLANIFHTSTAQSSILDDWSPVPGLVGDAPSSRGYEGGFKVGLMAKDFRLAVETAERVGVELRLGEEGLKVYDEAKVDPKCEGKDSRVVFRYLGGDEKWREKHPEDVPMKSYETKALLAWAREHKPKE